MNNDITIMQLIQVKQRLSKQKWITGSTHSSVKINKINIQISSRSMTWLWKMENLMCELVKPERFPLSKCCLVYSKLQSPSSVLRFLYKDFFPATLISNLFFSQLFLFLSPDDFSLLSSSLFLLVIFFFSSFLLFSLISLLLFSSCLPSQKKIPSSNMLQLHP